MGSRMMFAVIASAILCGCDGSSIPTAPPRCTTVTVFATEQWYLQRPEPEREFSGQLEFRNVPATPNGRDHRYFLANTPVYSGGTTSEAIFSDAAGAAITIRGKTVDVGFGPEIWSAALTSCR